MRILASILLLASAVIHLLLGGGHLLSAKYEQVVTNDLSAVSGDLVSPEELARMQKVERLKSGPVGRRSTILGAVALGATLCGIVAAILLLARRARRLALGLVAIALAGAVGLLWASGVSPLGGITCAALVLALVFTLLSRPRPGPIVPSAPVPAATATPPPPSE
jgi:hypothetical protein